MDFFAPLKWLIAEHVDISFRGNDIRQSHTLMELSGSQPVVTVDYVVTPAYRTTSTFFGLVKRRQEGYWLQIKQQLDAPYAELSGLTKFITYPLEEPALLRARGIITDVQLRAILSMATRKIGVESKQSPPSYTRVGELSADATRATVALIFMSFFCLPLVALIQFTDPLNHPLGLMAGVLGAALWLYMTIGYWVIADQYRRELDSYREAWKAFVNTNDKPT